MHDQVYKRLLENHLNLSVLLELYSNVQQTEQQVDLDTLVNHLQQMDKGYAALKASVANGIKQIANIEDDDMQIDAVERDEGYQV